MKTPFAFAAVLFAAVSLIIAGLLVTLVILNPQADRPSELYGLGFVTFSVVGAFIVANRPTNPIGWLFCLIGLTTTLDACSLQYAVYALRTHPNSLPGGPAAAWLGSGWAGTVGWGTMGLLAPLLFPNGRLLSPRWKVVLYAAVIAIGLQIGVQMIIPGHVNGQLLPGVGNPLGIEALAPYVSWVQTVSTLLDVVTLVFALSSLILRFRRGSTEERQQIKWFAYAGTLVCVLIALGLITSVVGSSSLDAVFNPLLVVGVCALPISAAIAITRYRLYDIDALINRTLVYALLTIVLGSLYIGGVLGLQALFRLVSGQSSGVAVALATLGIASLFSPLRARLQVFIDQRFYRNRYDAANILATLATRMRDEVDLDFVTSELVGVVHETMQPSHVSLLIL